MNRKKKGAPVYSAKPGQSETVEKKDFTPAPTMQELFKSMDIKNENFTSAKPGVFEKEDIRREVVKLADKYFPNL